MRIVKDHFIVNLFYVLLESLNSSCAVVLIQSESFPVVSLSPLVGSTGVFRKAFNHSLSNVLVHEGGDNAANQAIGL